MSLASNCPPAPPECNATYQFTCRDKFCKPLFWVCDSVRDCEDGSDEEGCSECGQGRGGGVFAQLPVALLLALKSLLSPCAPQAARPMPSSVTMGSASLRASSVTGRTTVAMGPMKPSARMVRPGPTSHGVTQRGA